MLAFASLLLTVPMAAASGHDVQLKDLRGSYFYVLSETASNAVPPKECAMLALTDTKKYGRLTHCNPEKDHVMCKPKERSEKLFLFETKEACEASLKHGVEPAIEED